MMQNVKDIEFKEFKDERGCLSAIEAERDVPFKIERIYYITKVPGHLERGFHSHRDLEQVLLCLNGSVRIRVDNGTDREEVLLDNPAKGLYIGPMIWREMAEFSEGSVLLVLASHHYDASDYIKDYAAFKEEAQIFWRNEK